MLGQSVLILTAGLGAAFLVPPGMLAQEVQPAGQESIVEACRGPEHRQFDFWLGDWEVTDTAGAIVGSNRIARVASGCGLLENWRGATGTEGTSLNWYEPQNGQWHQVWVGSGYYLCLTGGIEDGNMILSGDRQTPGGVVVDQITWIPLDDGRVRQVWKVSRDSGGSWQVLFDGIYARR
ncbi:MAG: hypothetical protein PVJ43_06140 [Gemmatimonadales bacterium]